jgi:small subunit ribosomal protein S20
MANIKSQIKRNRQNDGRRLRNKGVRTELKSEVKKVRTAAEAGDAETATALLRQTARDLDKAASKGSIHKRAAARRKSRLARQVNSAAAG